MANGIVSGGLYSVDGSFTLAGAAVGRGMFVVPNYENETVSIPSADGAADVWFVMNGITTPIELAENNADFTVKAGEKVELAKFQKGARFITDCFDGAFTDYDVGDVVMVGTSGKVKPDSSGAFKAVVREKLSNWCGAQALRCMVTVA